VTPELFFICFPDTNAPIGGIKQIYRQASLINQLGGKAWVVHESSDFRVEWFENDAPVIGLDQLKQRGMNPQADVLVFPETWHEASTQFAPGIGKIFFNQNAYYSLGVKDADQQFANGYGDSELFFHLFVSQDNEALAAYMFKLAPDTTGVLKNGIDTQRFAPRPHELGGKELEVAYMIRKNPEHVRKLLLICQQRGLMDRARFTELSNLQETDVATHMARARFFLSFEYPAGWPLPPAEAMASGCVVIGYHGQGGRDYFQPTHCHPINFGDWLSFASTLETLITVAETRPDWLDTMGAKARRFIESNYSLRAERLTAEETWSRAFLAWERWKSFQ